MNQTACGQILEQTLYKIAHKYADKIDCIYIW